MTALLARSGPGSGELGWLADKGRALTEGLLEMPALLRVPSKISSTLALDLGTGVWTAECTQGAQVVQSDCRVSPSVPPRQHVPCTSASTPWRLRARLVRAGVVGADSGCRCR